MFVIFHGVQCARTHTHSCDLMALRYLQLNQTTQITAAQDLQLQSQYMTIFCWIISHKHFNLVWVTVRDLTSHPCICFLFL